MEIWLIVAAAVVAGAFLLSRRSSAQKSVGIRGKGMFTSANSDHYVRPPYRAVAVKPGTPACRAARSVGNVRYLVDDAPLLPLSGCDAGSCTCKYVHFLDRRSSSLDRRRLGKVPEGGAPDAPRGDRRRSSKVGRRAGDKRRRKAD